MKIFSRAAMVAVLLVAMLAGCGKHEALDKNLTLARTSTERLDANYRKVIIAQAADMRAVLRDLYESKHQAAVAAEIKRGQATNTPESLALAVQAVQALERLKIIKYQEFEDYFAQIQAKVDEAGKDAESIILLMDNAKAYLATEKDKAAAIQGIVDTGGDVLQAYLDSANKPKAPKKTAIELTK